MDYCEDLLKDTNDTLIWLENINETIQSKNFGQISPFTFDFDSLYDSIKPDLVITAIRDAMNTCRKSWSEDFRDWIIESIKLSMKSAVGEFQNHFYKPLKGIATGGSLSVPSENIVVFYALKLGVYSDRSLMQNIISIKRFIDDGAGLHHMSKRNFLFWKKTVSAKVALFGLKIKETDWSEPENRHDPINFLDIQFLFDVNDSLQTDLYIKPTDSRSYLNFSSCHPNYTFSGAVYSQALRLRRIINDDDRLSQQLDNLQSDYNKCGYPQSLCSNIFEKVKKMPRTLIKAINPLNQRQMTL